VILGASHPPPADRAPGSTAKSALGLLNAPARARLEPLRPDHRRGEHARVVDRAARLQRVSEIVLVWRTLRADTISTGGGKALALGFIEATDIFLIGIVLFIFSLGVYILFIDDAAPRPAWLEIHDLDDLKAQLVSVVIAALAVNFLGHVVQWDGEPQLLGFGAAIGLVVAALAFFLNMKPPKKE
jgi:uncharacterized membrane protein YqhA